MNAACLIFCRLVLQACRRHKKLREPLSVSEVGSSGWLGRSMPGLLTSAEAELILAQACQNETNSAKRRRYSAPAETVDAPRQPIQVGWPAGLGFLLGLQRLFLI